MRIHNAIMTCSSNNESLTGLSQHIMLRLAPLWAASITLKCDAKGERKTRRGWECRYGCVVYMLNVALFTSVNK